MDEEGYGAVYGHDHSNCSKREAETAMGGEGVDCFVDSGGGGGCEKRSMLVFEEDRKEVVVSHRVVAEDSHSDYQGDNLLCEYPRRLSFSFGNLPSVVTPAIGRPVSFGGLVDSRCFDNCGGN